MKILLVTAEYGEAGGGLSYACTNFFNMLTKHLYYNVTVTSSVVNNIAIVPKGYNHSLYFKIASEYRLKADIDAFKDQDIDLVIAFGGSFNGYYASLISNGIKARFILLLRGTDVNLAKWDSQEEMYLMQATRYAYKISCLSNEMKMNFQNVTNTCDNSIMVIPNIIESHANSIIFPNLPNKVVIGTAATHINEKKGIANLLYMVKEYMTISNISIIFEVVGAIDKDIKNEYLETIDQLEIINHVRLLGYKSREEYHEITKSWDLYVQGSVCEGFGNSVSEAISNGKGIILSPTGYIAEALKENYSCMLFDNWNPSNMAKKLDVLINMPDKTKEYTRAYKYLQKLDKNTIISMWKSLIEDNKIAKINTEIRPSGILSIALHEVDGSIYDHITTPIDVFRKFCKDLCNNGYGLCSMKAYLKKSQHERSRWIVCTFDDGYSTLIPNVVPIFNLYGFSATVFVNTSIIGKDNSWNWKDSKTRLHLDKEGLITLNNKGWEIGSHGHTHRNLLKLSEKEVVAELSESKRILENIVGHVATFAYPYGDSSPYTRKICSSFYAYAFSLSQGGTELAIDNLQIRRYSIDDIYKILEI